MKKSERPLYIISVAARLAQVHPQTLRIYERKGLLSPSRTKKRRLYSEEDIERLKLIQKLTQEERVNLAGVKLIMNLQDELDKYCQLVGELESRLEQVRQQMEEEIMMLHREHSPKIEKIPRGEMVKVKIDV